MAAITLIDLHTDKVHAGIAMSDAHILGHVSVNANEVWWRNGYGFHRQDWTRRNTFSSGCCIIKWLMYLFIK